MIKVIEQPCRVCGLLTSWFEPRFGYFACPIHRTVPPVEIQKYSLDLNGKVIYNNKMR